MMWKYGYAHGNLWKSIRCLMAPVGDYGRAVSGAMHEMSLALRDRPEDESLHRSWDTIHRLMQGDGSWDERAERLAEEARNDLSEAFLELYDAVSALHFAERFTASPAR